MEMRNEYFGHSKIRIFDRTTGTRPGYIHPPIIGSGKFSGVCVLHALWRPEVHLNDHTQTKERLAN